MCNDGVNLVGISCQNFQALSLTWPTASDQCFGKNTTQSITWESQGNIPHVNIELCNTLSFLCQDIAINTTNSGTYSFTLPTDLDNGYYNIKLSDAANNSNVDNSGIFEINSNCNAVCDPVIVSLNQPRNNDIIFCLLYTSPSPRD